ncbi:MAG: hypothetical protein AB7K63_13740 [Vicinamibacterales bacterium]
MQVFLRGALAVSLGLAAPLAAQAQDAAADAAPLRAFRTFSRDTGSRELPQSTVTAVHEDREGVVWILTLDGIARVERDIVERVPAAPDAPLSGPFYAVADRRGGGIHTTGDDAVVSWNGRAWSRIPTPVTFRAVAEDASGRLVAADTLGAVWEYGSDRRWAKLTAQDAPRILVLGTTTDGTVLAGGEDGVREVRDALRPPLTGSAIGSAVAAMRVTRAGDVWTATEDGRLRRLPRGGGRWQLVPLDGWDGGPVHAIGEDVHGRIWLGGERGRIAFGQPGSRLQYWRPDNGVTPGTINTIAGDRTGGVWIGFAGLGLQQWLGGAWSHRPYWTDPREPAPVAPVGFSRTQRGFLAAVPGRGVWRWDGGRLTSFGTREGLAEEVRSTVEPEPGVIWAGTRRGLFESRDGGPFRRVFSLSVNAGAINAIVRAPDGQWWAATEQAGLFVRIASGEWRPHLQLNGLLPDVNVRHLAWRRTGELWVATPRGLAAYRAGSLERLSLPEPPPAIASPFVILEAADRVWVGGGGGLAALDGGMWQTLAPEPLQGARVSSLAAAPDGAIWVGTSRGISRYSDGRWDVYTVANGLLAEETNPLALVVLPSGDVFAGTAGGLAHFSASEPALPDAPLRVFWRRDASRLADGPITLPAEERGLTLQWSAPWPRPVTVEYRTRMPSLGDRWSAPQASSELRVENLAAGEWGLEVAARVPGTGEAGWSEPLRATVIVQPFWYETAWARFGAAALAGLAIIGLVQWRTGRQRRRAARLERALERELARVKILRGLLPICSFCKKIRDDGGYWNQLEQYVAANSQADFSHAVCPDCMTREYPELVRLKPDTTGEGDATAR